MIYLEAGWQSPKGKQKKTKWLYFYEREAKPCWSFGHIPTALLNVPSYKDAQIQRSESCWEVWHFGGMVSLACFPGPKRGGRHNPLLHPQWVWAHDKGVYHSDNRTKQQSAEYQNVRWRCAELSYWQKEAFAKPKKDNNNLMCVHKRLPSLVWSYPCMIHLHNSHLGDKQQKKKLISGRMMLATHLILHKECMFSEELA